MKIMSIIGTRPNYIKLDPELKQIIVNTGQHFSKGMRYEDTGLKLPKPKYNLNETKLGRMIEKLCEVIVKENPETILVYGDTNSTLAGAIAAKKCGKKLVHIEAGMRSGVLEMPEEQNRRMVDQISDFLLCVSKRCADTLEREGVLGRIGICGNVMLDTIWEALPTKPIKEYGEYVLLTIHRAGTADDPEALKEVFEALKDYKVIFPVHPRTLKTIKKYKIKYPKNFVVLEPVNYKRMIHLIASAKKVITDSGGLQVEAHFLRIPCITLRNETEWNETVEQGWNTLVGTDKLAIKKALEESTEIAKPRNLVYGDGKANEKIRNFINSL
jgi:UDP-GlcNAc3NAcA epimerase